MGLVGQIGRVGHTIYNLLIGMRSEPIIYS